CAKNEEGGTSFDYW
nr:immunoglobulin heavy chain junction region [Macaca mulatta]MOV87692.1 immunoglobulin heavy chain junction region [Macaca mulatta]MOV88002.1 immunoglobulin heavy chain junction region [Macaca mulatta]MOV88287.1 immunoglobulin heavy chain junction region [Macaca mulatta]MOV89864.1 immunoglobulin heavy chain junction region [Macaca mulatta]